MPNSIQIGPSTPFSKYLHQHKYREEGESFNDAAERISTALADNLGHKARFKAFYEDMAILPAGRVQAAVGAKRRTTPYNCFVSGTISDSFVDGEGSIMQRATESATTMRVGGGIGYDFSTLRPRGDLIKKLSSNSSGPVSFMGIYDAVCRCVSSAGHRRGAQMGVLRVDHPDILEFITAKNNTTNLTGFNTSVGVTNHFMECLLRKKPFDLVFEGKVYDTVNPEMLWEQIMVSTWNWAEPGVLFIDTINRMNNLWYCEHIAATNPCGEQPLPPHGACLLASLNLVKFLDRDKDFNFDDFGAAIHTLVRAMDNVIDPALYPLEAQRVEATTKRRMGIGVTALANTLETQGAMYGSDEFIQKQVDIFEVLRDEAYTASALLAKEKGPFALFDKDQYLAGEFVQTLPGHIRDLIAKYGIRNSHLTSIAPTGTISSVADNVSSGIEPVFSYKTQRTYMGPDGPQEVEVEDYAHRVFGTKGKRTDEVTIDEHLEVLAVASRFVDSAVSKTCNVDPNMNFEDFKQIYVKAWAKGCKGCTTFNIGGKRFGILKSVDETPKTGEACSYDPQTGARTCEQ